MKHLTGVQLETGSLSFLSSAGFWNFISGSFLFLSSVKQLQVCPAVTSQQPESKPVFRFTSGFNALIDISTLNHMFQGSSCRCSPLNTCMTSSSWLSGNLRSSAVVDVSLLAHQHLNDLNVAEPVRLVTPVLQALSSDWLPEATPTGLMCIS